MFYPSLCSKFKNHNIYKYVLGEAHLIHLSLRLLQSPITGHVALRGNSRTGSRTDTLERNWSWPKVEIGRYYTFNRDVFIFCSSFFNGFQFWNPSCLVMSHSSLKLMSIFFSCHVFKSIVRIVLLQSCGKKSVWRGSNQEASNWASSLSTFYPQGPTL